MMGGELLALIGPQDMLSQSGILAGSLPSRDAALVRRRLGRDHMLDVLGAGLGLVLVLALAYRAWRETGNTNTYAALADAWLHGRMWVERCFDIDCVVKDGVTHVIFPPFPAAVAAPFVGIAGPGFSHFIALALGLGAVSGACWWSIARQANLDRRTTLWLLAAILLGSPVLYVTMRGDGIWFFAQVVSFTLYSVMLWACLVRRSAWIAGLCVGLAFLSRQMAILIAPAVFMLLLAPEERILPIRRETLRRALAFAAPILVTIGIYLAYNAARFGNPLDTGYGLLSLRNSGSLLDERLTQNGTFSAAYFLQNLFYLTVQGFHADFAGPKALTLSGLDQFGTALLAASPWLFALLLVRPDRRLWAATATAATIAGITLFYHSNGFTQYNAQRYTLDWLPLLLAFVPACFGRLNPTVMRGLVLYAMALNLIALLVLQVTRT